MLGCFLKQFVALLRQLGDLSFVFVIFIAHTFEVFGIGLLLLLVLFDVVGV